MKIAVSDACIFIDIIQLNIIHLFFSLPIEVHTSLEVFNELNQQQKAILSAYQLGKLLYIHNLNPQEREQLMLEQYPRALSCTDKSVIFLAKKLGATIISSDKPVRTFAKEHSTEYHGMLWILDQLIEKNLINTSSGIDLLTQLVNSNLVYQNNFDLTAEATKRIRRWSRL